MEAEKTWDQFIARQVQCHFTDGERMFNAVWDPPSTYRGVYIRPLQDALQSKDPGMIWVYTFGRALGASGCEYWWVNLTTQKVYAVQIID